MTTSREGRYFPPRPTLTAPFICAMLFWAACAASYSTGDVRDQSVTMAIAAASAVGAAVSAAIAVSKRARPAALAAVSIALGCLLGCAQAAYLHAGAQSLEGLAGAPAELTLLEDSMDYGFGESALVESSIAGAGKMAFSARLGGCGPLLVGQRVTATVSFEPIDYAEDSYAWQDGSCGQLTATGVEVADAPFPLGPLIALRGAAIERIGDGDDPHALLQALVCGYRRNVSHTEMYAQFQACGLAHLVAVSGAHLLIVTGLIASLLKRARAPRRATIVVLVAVMASYYVIAGMPVSALRATIMSSLGLVSFFGKRRPSSLNAVGIGLFAILIAAPASCVSASLVLSALSTVGIVVFAPLLQAWFERTPLVRVPAVLDAFSLTFAASLLSQLYACSLFDQLPLIAPLANVASAPLFPLVCGSGLAFGFGRATLFSQVALGEFVPVTLAGALAGVAGFMANLPFASVPFTVDTTVALASSAAVALVLWAWWPHPGFKPLVATVAACLFVAIVVALAVPGDRIVMLDVGQGDSFLIQSRGQSLLVDTGNKDAALLHGLASNRVTHLDSVLITHADDDHCGSLDQIEKSVDVDRVIVAQDMLGCTSDSAEKLIDQAGKTARDVVGVEMGDSFTVGAFTAKVIWPRAFAQEGGNADSLCLLLEYDGDDDGSVDFKALMTGDAEKDELAEMIGAGLVGDVDILKVGHHGSRNGMTADELAVLEPEVALISCGLNNRYGHPKQEILDLLDGVGAKTYRTDRDGEVACTLTAERISVSSVN